MWILLPAWAVSSTSREDGGWGMEGMGVGTDTDNKVIFQNTQTAFTARSNTTETKPRLLIPNLSLLYFMNQRHEGQQRHRYKTSYLSSASLFQGFDSWNDQIE